MEAIQNLKQYFPIMSKKNDVMSLVIAIVVYVAVGAVIGAVVGLLSWIPVVGLILRIVTILVDVYCLAGIILAVLAYIGTIE